MNIQTRDPATRKIALEAFEEIRRSLDSAPNLSEAEKSKAKEAIDQTAYVAREVPNTAVYQIAVASLAVAAGIIVLGGLYIAIAGGETPDFLKVTLATIIGALAGMVVPTSRGGL